MAEMGTEVAHGVDYQRRGHCGGEDVGYTECVPHAVEPHAARKPQQQGNEKQHLSGEAQEYAQAHTAYALKIGGAGDLESDYGKREHAGA